MRARIRALFAVAALASSAFAGGDKPAIGASVADLRFTDTRWLPRSLSEFGERKAFVLAFTTVDCPVAQRYLPKLVELERTYRGRGVQFLAIDVGAGDSIVDVAAQAVEGHAEFPFVKDFDGRVVRALGVERTPEVVVLDGARKLCYRGRIDDQYRLGGARPQSSRDDLVRALEDVLAGRALEVSETPVDGCVIGSLELAAPRAGLTWSHDVAKIVQTHCQDCHRPGQVAPFSLLTFQDAADHAETIAEVVRQKRMPPWYASRAHGSFSNAPSITDDERATLVDWCRSGAAAGDLTTAPPPREFPQVEWSIGEPDLVLRQLDATAVPAEGYVDYQYVLLPHVFSEDTYLEAVEIKPDNPRVVHHANLGHFKLTEKFRMENFVTGFVPGGDPLVCEPGTAFKVPKGAMLGLQVHVVTTGKPEKSRVSVGLRFPRTRVQRELHHFQIHDNRFEIPPFAPAFPIDARQRFDRDATGIGMVSHMHLRGRDMSFVAHYPDGRDETLLLVPNYSFDWQDSYRWPSGAQKFPAGTRVDVLAHYDNSKFNPYNPDPSRTVKFSQQTDGEMMYGFVFFTYDDEKLDLDVDPKTGQARTSGG
jgi:peroxiredoxin